MPTYDKRLIILGGQVTLSFYLYFSVSDIDPTLQNEDFYILNVGGGGGGRDGGEEGKANAVGGGKLSEYLQVISLIEVYGKAHFPCAGEAETATTTLTSSMAIAAAAVTTIISCNSNKYELQQQNRQQ